MHQLQRSGDISGAAGGSGRLARSLGILFGPCGQFSTSIISCEQIESPDKLSDAKIRKCFFFLRGIQQSVFQRF